MRSTRSINSRAPSSTKRSWRLSTKRLASSESLSTALAPRRTSATKSKKTRSRVQARIRPRKLTLPRRTRWTGRAGAGLYIGGSRTWRAARHRSIRWDEAGDVTATPPPSVQSIPTYSTAARRPTTSSLPRPRSPLGSSVVARRCSVPRGTPRVARRAAQGARGWALSIGMEFVIQTEVEGEPLSSSDSALAPLIHTRCRRRQSLASRSSVVPVPEPVLKLETADISMQKELEPGSGA
ncbi:hypothetical protein FA95DRAFT_937644 [Auriscalpium vulgare]|uniref:Uncharacterized protein n=1 Tax=Auriscalpium vulgare TaxID=40419 RepID=A0ACB8SB42_9AGAM|nr:hypothetical protein FA95DRAFT_937644 [Auriscalpium vulgare]